MVYILFYLIFTVNTYIYKDMYISYFIWFLQLIHIFIKMRSMKN